MMVCSPGLITVFSRCKRVASFASARHWKEFCVKEKMESMLIVHLEKSKPECLGHFGLDIKPDQCWLSQTCLREVNEEPRQGGGEEEGLPSVGKPGQNLPQLFSQPHLKKSVSLVKDNVFHGVEFEAHLEAEVDETAGCGEENVGVRVNRRKLALH